MLFDEFVGPEGLSATQLRTALNAEVDAGMIEKSGKGRAMLYRLKQTVTPVTPPSNAEGRPLGEQVSGNEGTVEGKLLAVLELEPGGLSAPEIALRLDTPLHSLRPVIGGLMREGEVRTRKHGRDTLYVKAMVAA